MKITIFLEHTKTLAEKRKSFSLSQRSSSIMNKPTILTSVDENKELTPPQSCEETEYYENEKQSTSVGTYLKGNSVIWYGRDRLKRGLKTSI